FFTVQRAFAPAGIQVTRAALFKEAPAADVLLVNGDAVAVGDGLYLEVEADRRFHLYVLNEDEKGERHLLFPRRDWALANPLEGGRRLRVPGQAPWEVSSAGGREWVFIVASEIAIPELEALAREAPPAEYAAVQGEPLQAVLRGIGKIKEVKVAAQAPSRPVLAEFTRDLKGLSEGARTATGLWVRAIHLRNP
ncbi:MAG: DUF4384 domain-containing protein, partial [Thermoanaerobaculia bacterium]